MSRLCVCTCECACARIQIIFPHHSPTMLRPCVCVCVCICMFTRANPDCISTPQPHHIAPVCVCVCVYMCVCAPARASSDYVPAPLPHHIAPVSHGTHMYEAWHTRVWVMALVSSARPRVRFQCLVYMRCTHGFVMAHIRTRHVTGFNSSRADLVFYIYICSLCLINIDASGHTYRAAKTRRMP